MVRVRDGHQLCPARLRLTPRLQDPVFDFEKKRNRPVKYNRELVGTTIRYVAYAACFDTFERAMLQFLKRVAAAAVP